MNSVRANGVPVVVALALAVVVVVAVALAPLVVEQLAPLAGPVQLVELAVALVVAPQPRQLAVVERLVVAVVVERLVVAAQALPLSQSDSVDSQCSVGTGTADGPSFPVQDCSGPMSTSDSGPYFAVARAPDSKNRSS